MKSILTPIKNQLIEEDYSINSSDARKWIERKARELKVTPQRIAKERGRYRNSTFIGKMYFFFYDPKTKDKLTYYDRFPLVIPIEKHRDGFLGINLHYVEPKIRIKILNKLMKNLTDDRMDELTRMRINYNFLLTLSTSNLMLPCLKKYLYSFVQSRFLYVEPNEWKFCTLLPFEIFEKENKRKVFKESEDKF
jgi:hypothetical protein